MARVRPVDLRDLVDFAEGEVVTKPVFESERLWSQLLCLDRNGTYGPVTDRDSDAMLTIVTGEAVVLVDRKRHRIKQWTSVVAPAGSELSVANASAEPLVILLVVAPPPTPRSLTG